MAADPPAWRVLLLSVGRSTENVRSELVSHLHGLGFQATSYDNTGYPADPGRDTVAACIEAIDQHDIVLAVLDEQEGSEVRPDRIDPKIREYLEREELLPAPGSGLAIPTIVQLEVLTALKRGKPTLRLISKSASDGAGALMNMLQAGELELMPRSSSPAAPAQELIDAENWRALARFYEVPSGVLASFRHVLFLRDLQEQWAWYYAPASLEDLRAKASEALSNAPLMLVRSAFAQVSARLNSIRPPVGALSLGDLLRRRLILPPPYRVMSGADSGEIYSPETASGALREWLTSRESVLLLGQPGLGKSTLAMLVHASLQEDAASVPQLGVLWGRWRDLGGEPSSVQGTLARLLGRAHDRGPWPLVLPNLRWVLVLDGLDESPLPAGEASGMLSELSEHVTLLVSCRANDSARYRLDAVSFQHQIRLTPWGSEQLERYARALTDANLTRGAAAVGRAIATRRRPSVIGYPLWLAMLVYLAEEDEEPALEQLDDYELVHRTMRSVGESELTRHRGNGYEFDALSEALGITAALLQDRRGARPVTLAELERRLALAAEGPVMLAVRSFLELSAETVRGFRHEVIHDYWLGEHIAGGLPGADGPRLLELLGTQRRVLANDAVRRSLARLDRGGEAAETLRGRLHEVPEDARSAFVKNQMLYFLGRLDDSPTTKEFLAGIARSDEPEFVRYSAAFTGAMIGAEGVERDYYRTLRENEDSDRLNRGYHLFYHGDVDLPEEEMPYYDDASVRPERAAAVLVERLGLSEPKNLRLRRIELFTLRRFIETRPAGAIDLHGVEGHLEGVEAERSGDAERDADIGAEIAGIRKAIAREA